MTSDHRLTDRIKRTARDCGFDALGVCRSDVLRPERERYLTWLAEGRHGDMAWLTPTWAEIASDPSSQMKDARSVVCVSLSYAGPPASRTPPGAGRMARYATGSDYHAVLGTRLTELSHRIQRLGGSTRPFVDTAPTMDKALAVRAGLGWQGRNTNVLNRELGSFTFLGGVITDLALEPDEPAVDGCGACRACIVACPTGALKGDYTIDARLCISYLTIEHRGVIPRELRALMGDWVFGCDICQDVCPPVTDLQDRDYPGMKRSRVAHLREVVKVGSRQAAGDR